MSALLDSLTVGGYDGSADGGIGTSGYTVYPTVSTGNAAGGDFWSGLLQTSATLGTGYLTRLMDIDLTKKYVNSMPQATVSGTQNPVQYGAVVKANGQQYATLNLSQIMPLLLVAAVVFVVAKKKGG